MSDEGKGPGASADTCALAEVAFQLTVPRSTPCDLSRPGDGLVHFAAFFSGSCWPWLRWLSALVDRDGVGRHQWTNCCKGAGRSWWR